MKNLIRVKLSSVSDVQDFVKECSSFEEDIYMTSGRYIINAKSIMGIFSLNLSEALRVHIDSTDELVCEDFQQRLHIYEATDE